jgi:type I restriction enzyme S subunit
MPRVDWHTLATRTIYLPPLPEQLAIVDYLDRQTALIDQRLETLVEKKSVLAELRKATIHEAVTKGCKWNAETGLIENLPNSWETSQAKRLFQFITSGSRGWAEYYADEGDIFLRIGNLTRETIELDLNDVQYVRLPANATEGSRTRIKEGDMLVSITADLGSIAVAPKLNKPAYVNQHIALCRPKKLVHPRWLGYAMVSIQTKQQMLNSGYGGTKIQLSLDDVRHVWLAVSPHAEQRAIANYLDQQNKQFDAQFVTLDEQAKILKELRKAIIHEAVTGKIELQVKQFVEKE